MIHNLRITVIYIFVGMYQNVTKWLDVTYHVQP